MAEKICIRIPSDDALSERSGWASLGDGTYSAIRFHVLVIKQRERSIVKGPAIEVLNLPGGSEYKYERKNARIVKNTLSIQESIQETVTTKLAQEVTKKIASEIGATGVLPSAKLSSEVQLKSGVELTDAVQSGLTRTRSYEIQNSEEITRSVSYKSDGSSRPSLSLHFYLGLWPWRWDFYLLKVEYLRLRYAKHMFWFDVRKTISQATAEPKVPLFRASFYEPQADFSISEGSHFSEIADDGDEITVGPFTDPAGKAGCPAGAPLEELARHAFPVTRAEKRKRLTAAKKASVRGRFVNKGRVLSKGRAAKKKAGGARFAGETRHSVRKKQAAKKKTAKKTKRKAGR
jgi:hypothetical protein